jgi:hypothetical protein
VKKLSAKKFTFLLKTFDTHTFCWFIKKTDVKKITKQKKNCQNQHNVFYAPYASVILLGLPGSTLKKLRGHKKVK